MYFQYAHLNANNFGNDENATIVNTVLQFYYNCMELLLSKYSFCLGQNFILPSPQKAKIKGRV